MIEILNFLLVYQVPVLSYEGDSFCFCIGLPNLTVFLDH